MERCYDWARMTQDNQYQDLIAYNGDPSFNQEILIMIEQFDNMTLI